MIGWAFMAGVAAGGCAGFFGHRWIMQKLFEQLDKMLVNGTISLETVRDLVRKARADT